MDKLLIRGGRSLQGEVLVSGPNVMQGYWGRPEATADAFTADGQWFRSGDVAVTDEDGYVYLVDRIKDMIISGGENIYPAEVENAIAEHPAVADCGVFGVPDEKWGETGRAVVVLRPGETATAEELRGFLLGRILAQQQVTDRPIAVGHGLQHALAQVTALVAIAQFESLAGTGGSTGRGAGAADDAAVQDHVRFNGRVAAGVQDLTALDVDDLCHSCMHSKDC